MMIRDFIITLVATKAIKNMWNSVHIISKYRRELEEKIVVTKNIAKILKLRIRAIGPTFEKRTQRTIKLSLSLVAIYMHES
jgi:hypothetical protein